jgi:hypothetical protein
MYTCQPHFLRAIVAHTLSAISRRILKITGYVYTENKTIVITGLAQDGE